MAERPNCVMEELPCGCKIGVTDANEVVFEAHSTDCKYYLYVIAEAKRQGKPLELRSVD